jgi:hypothetical protein
MSTARPEIATAPPSIPSRRRVVALRREARKGVCVIRRILVVVAVVVMCAPSPEAQAAPITINPGSGVVTEGLTTTVGFVVSGLGNAGLPNLGAFDLELHFDSTFLRPTRVSFFGSLGDPDVRSYHYDTVTNTFVGDVFGSGAALSGVTGAPTSVRVENVSLLEDSLATCVFCTGPYLEDLQSSPFVIVAVMFRAVLAGTASLQLAGQISDGNGNPIVLDPSAASIQVVPVPEPSSLLLMVTAAPWLLKRARRRRPRDHSSRASARTRPTS